MKLSVVIVNYNVKHFLEQCIHSVYAALHAIEAEIFVVDNNSVDGSVQTIESRFPDVKLIANKENLGFSKANNQAIREARGEYILLLNPDTVISEDTLVKTIAFMDANSNAGSLGVKMIDGRGNFLPESKRALPTPSVAFYKTFGISKLFPKSHRFGKYHLTYLSKDETNEVDILPGAFMLIRKEVLDKIGLLDETFFMYGEDIDLSYRIQQAGYKNYYFPETTIIHYKGESTKKTSVNYVFVFYNAMLIFARKHYSQKNIRALQLLIRFAIYFRAFLAIIRRFFIKYLQPATDAVLSYVGMYFFAKIWSAYFFESQKHFPKEYYLIAVPIYTLIWIISLLFSGGYDKPVRFKFVLRGIIVGAVTILVVYALLPLEYRFSRINILFGSGWIVLHTFITRVLFSKIWPVNFKFNISRNKKRFLFVGNPGEVETILDVIKRNAVSADFIGVVCADNAIDNEHVIGKLNQLEEIVSVNKIDEIVFSASNVSSKNIMQQMLLLEKHNIDFKIASPDGISIIGSSSIDTAGDLYILDFNSLSKPANLRKKRIFDLLGAFILLFAAPVLAFRSTSVKNYLRNCLRVIFGKNSLISYDSSTDISKLPKLKRGVLFTSDIRNEQLSEETIERINLSYARDYYIKTDIAILLKSLKKLGRKL
jgi:GT2 family glycosyltransferase